MSLLANIALAAKARIEWDPEAERITSPADGVEDQPFCGAEISTSTPVASMSTQAQPDAMQSSTISAPTSCAAEASAVM